jgi:glycosyltransferase involved in cell wall biosynthesis
MPGAFMSKPASISILIPTRNRAHTLRQTIEAMQQQTAAYDELIVGDDASDDHTRETVAEFRDPRIQYVHHQNNLGIYGNWNDLIGRASGDYLCIYHDHDRYLPHILETDSGRTSGHRVRSYRAALDRLPGYRSRHRHPTLSRRNARRRHARHAGSRLAFAHHGRNRHGPPRGLSGGRTLPTRTLWTRLRQAHVV